MTRLVPILAACWLSACAVGSGGTSPAAGPGSSSAKAVELGYSAYARQQDEIKLLNSSAQLPLGNYGLAKAQCWLDTSLHEYSRNDRSAYPEQALAQSMLMTDLLKATDNKAAEQMEATPLINEAEKLRDDLWKKITALKASPGRSCANTLIACAEVELVHAGNEYRQQGWRHAKPYVQIAEDKLEAASHAASNCVIPKQPSIVPVPQAQAQPQHTPAPPQQAPTLVTEKHTLSASALFRFDGRSQSDLLPEGRQQIDELLRRIKATYVKVQSIELVGHTDRLGTSGYNQLLSQDRASTVRDYFVLKGFDAGIITSGAASTQPIVDCPQHQPLELQAKCLQPNRRVEITIVGMKHGN